MYRISLWWYALEMFMIYIFVGVLFKVVIWSIWVSQTILIINKCEVYKIQQQNKGTWDRVWGLIFALSKISEMSYMYYIFAWFAIRIYLLLYTIQYLYSKSTMRFPEYRVYIIHTFKILNVLSVSKTFMQKLNIHDNKVSSLSKALPFL